MACVKIFPAAQGEAHAPGNATEESPQGRAQRAVQVNEQVKPRLTDTADHLRLLTRGKPP
jgi:hypothetical protein